jgi:2',3'-cyclic-nucleotide 2'-phosphodiesterase (5'-nucleotidase family)
MRAALLLLILALAAAAETVTLTVLHTNDLHGALLPNREWKSTGGPPVEVGGASRLASAIAAERASAAKDGRPLLLLDAGDFFHGSPEGNETRGAAVLAWMNLVGYDAMALGNHEWAYGEEALRSLRPDSRFPWLTCNVVRVDPESPEAPIVDYARPYSVLKAGTLRVAVVGFTAPGTPGMNLPEHCAGLDFLPYARQGAYYQKKARAEADVVIALTHLGTQADQSLARKAPGWDLIVGGHDHRDLPEGIEVERTLIVQAGCSGAFLGRVDMAWDTESKRIVKRTARLIPVTGAFAADPASEKLVASLVREGFDAQAGATAAPITRAGPDCALGALAADGVRATTGADAALLNSGALRGDLPAGPVSRRDLYMAAPFEDTFVVWKLSGADLRLVLDGAFRDGRLAYPVSGLSFGVDSKRPAGQRILGLKVGDSPLDPAKIYTLATTRFAAARLESDTVTRKILAPGGQSIARSEPGGNLQQALLRAFEGGIVVAPPEGGRVTFVDK